MSDWICSQPGCGKLHSEHVAERNSDVYEFAGWLSEQGLDLRNLPNTAIVAIVDEFFFARRNYVLSAR